MDDPFRPIRVTDHAADRARTRMGVEQRRRRYERIEGELRVAVLEGRTSRSLPEWCAYDTTPRARKDRTFYAWPEGADPDYCFVVFESAEYVVLTVLPAKSRDVIVRSGPPVRAGMRAT